MLGIDFVSTKIHNLKMKITGIEWDDGNWPKCGKHGMGQDEVEYALRHMRFRIPDPNPQETRFRTASRAPNDDLSLSFIPTGNEMGKAIFFPLVPVTYMEGR